MDIVDAIFDGHLLEYIMDNIVGICFSYIFGWKNVINANNRGYCNGVSLRIESAGNHLTINYENDVFELTFNDKSITHHGDPITSKYPDTCDCDICTTKVKDLFCRQGKSSRQGKYK